MLILFSLIGGWDQQHQQSGGCGTASQDANSAWNQQNSGAAAQPDQQQQQQQYDWSQGTVTVSSLCLLVLVHVIDLSTVHCDHV